MNDKDRRKAASDPQDLERLLIERQWQGDVEGMVALYEKNAVLDNGQGRLAVGEDEIRIVFAECVSKGKRFCRGKQSNAVVSGDLALTSTRLPDGSVTAEVARRQADGTWLWVIDRFSVL